MAINPIALGVQVPQLANPMEMYGNALRLKSMQQQNALAEQQMAALQQEQQRNALMDEAYAGAFDPKTGSLDYNQLYSKVPGRMIPGLMRGRAEQQEAQFKADRERLGYAKDFMENVQAQFRPDMTLDEVMALRRATYDHPVVGPILLQSGVDPKKRDAETVAVFTPRPNETQEAFRQRTNDYIYGLSMGAAKFAEKLKTVSLGGEEALVTPSGSRVATFQKTQTPGEAEQRRHNLAMEGIQRKQEQRLAGTATDGSTEIAPKDRQKREAAFPQARASYNAATNEIDTLRNDLIALRAHPGLAGITGGIEGRMPSFLPKASAAQAKLDKILARGQFRELQNLRANSPTGAAVGNVSDKEGAALRASFGALDQKQGLEDFQLAIDDVIRQLDFSKNNITQAFDDTYAYRQPNAAASSPVAPRPTPTNAPITVTTPDGKVLAFPSAAQAEAFKKAAGIK